MPGGVGPAGGDAHPPQEEPPAAAEHPLASPPARRRIRLSFHHLNALALIIILSVGGMASLADLAFFAFSFAYLHFLARVAFPATSPGPEPPVFGKNRALGIYVLAAAVVGQFAPVGYILWGVLGGDTEGVKAAAPHLFLLSCQVLMEGVAFWGNFSLPMFAFVPVFYNTKRLFTIADWLHVEMAKAGEEHGPRWRLHLGRGLAAANLAFWSFNLFAFLLPVYLPRVFQRYHGRKLKD